MVYVLPRLALGGSEKHLVWLAGQAVAAGARATIVCLYEAGPLAAEALEAGVAVESLGLGGVRDPRGVARRWRLYARLDPHVVHSCLFGFDALAALPARLRSVPLVVSARRELPGWMRLRHRAARWLGNRLSHRVVCCSTAVERAVLREAGIDARRVVTIGNGVALERFAGTGERRAAARRDWRVSAGDWLCVTVANFGLEKGHRQLLEAARRALAAVPELLFVWAGDGPLRGETAAAVAAAGLSERVRLPGQVADVAGLLAAADCFALASLSEGSPNALLEAMASGLASVATAVGGVPELVEDGVSGVLVPAGDPAALAEAILALRADPERAARLGRAARARAGRMPLEAVAQRYVELYRAGCSRCGA